MFADPSEVRRSANDWIIMTTDTIEKPESTSTLATPPTYTELAAQFRPVFDRIRDTAVERETDRRLAHDEVSWLREAGFGRVRVPVEYGGFGATLSQLIELLVELGEADANLPQLWRGHHAFVESRLNSPDRLDQKKWFDLIVDGAVIGNAQAERGPETASSALLEETDDGWRLTGEKYYSTGSIYADWIWTGAVYGGSQAGLAVRADQPNVTRLDDWDGFGQRLTGSGTTRFERAVIEPEHIVFANFDDERTQANITSFYQTVLLAALAGTGRAVLRDAVDFVRGRTRTFGVLGASRPADDPLVQRVIGKLSALSATADALVRDVARALEANFDRFHAGDWSQDDYDETLITVFRAQQQVIAAVLESTTLLFEVGGASATSSERQLDRHWRNARTLSSHNPAILRERAIGDYLLNGTRPVSAWSKRAEKAGTSAEG